MQLSKAIPQQVAVLVRRVRAAPRPPQRFKQVIGALRLHLGSTHLPCPLAPVKPQGLSPSSPLLTQGFLDLSLEANAARRPIRSQSPGRDIARYGEPRPLRSSTEQKPPVYLLTTPPRVRRLASYATPAGDLAS